jgi:hypothetical protein
MQDGSERREHRRLPYNREVKFAWLRDGCIAWPAHRLYAEDISKSGIRLKGDIKPDGATSGVVEIKREDGTRAVMGVHVVYTRSMINTPALAAHNVNVNANSNGDEGVGGGVAGARFFALTDELIERELTDAEGRVTGLDAYIAA